MPARSRQRSDAARVMWDKGGWGRTKRAHAPGHTRAASPAHHVHGNELGASMGASAKVPQAAGSTRQARDGSELGPREVSSSRFRSSNMHRPVAASPSGRRQASGRSALAGVCRHPCDRRVHHPARPHNVSTPASSVPRERRCGAPRGHHAAAPMFKDTPPGSVSGAPGCNGRLPGLTCSCRWRPPPQPPVAPPSGRSALA